MKGFLAVLRRELAEGRNLLLTALVLTLLPQAARVVPLPSGRFGSYEVWACGLVAFVGFVLIASAVTGASALGRDLATGRLGFFFSRPLSAAAIWGGKLSAAFLLSATGAFLLLVPLLSMGELRTMPPWSMALDGTIGLLAALLLLLTIAFLVLGAHLVGVAYRSRSPWIVVDLVLLAIVVLWGARILRRLILFGPFGGPIVSGALWSLAAALVVCLVAATAVQVSRARTDLRRGHAVLSLTFWAALLPCLAAADLTGRWLVAVRPSDLVSVQWVEPAPAGGWVRLVGRARWRGAYPRTLLYDVETGAFLRGAALLGPSAFSDDGRRVAALEWGFSGPRDAPPCLLLGDLAASPPALVRTTLCFPAGLTPISLLWSRDGGSLLLVQPGRLTVHEMPSLRLRTSVVRAADGVVRDACFATEDTVRLYAEGKDELRVLELDVPRGRLIATGQLPTDTLDPSSGARRRSMGGTTLKLSPRGDRILVQQRVGQAFTLHDARSAVPLATVSTAAGAALEFLSDGRIAAVEAMDGALRLRLLSTEAREERVVDLGPPPKEGSRPWLRIGGEPAPGLLAVGLRQGQHPGGSETRIVDLTRGQVLRSEPGLFPERARAMFSLVRRPVPGSVAARLFTTDGGALVRLDPERAGVQVVLRTGR